MTSSMREYRRTRRAVGIFLATYFVAGLATLLLPAREIFPIYNWFLFALVPEKTARYELRVFDQNQKPLAPPRSVTVYQLTQQIGATNDPTARALLEKNWLPPGARYEIVRVAPTP